MENKVFVSDFPRNDSYRAHPRLHRQCLSSRKIDCRSLVGNPRFRAPAEASALHRHPRFQRPRTEMGEKSVIQYDLSGLQQKEMAWLQKKSSDGVMHGVNGKIRACKFVSAAARYQNVIFCHMTHPVIKKGLLLNEKN